MSDERYWIAINGASCALTAFPMRHPLVIPTPEQLLGFPTLDEARKAQQVCLNAPMPEVKRFMQSLSADVMAGRVRVIKPKHPEPPTSGQTAWMEVHYTAPRQMPAPDQRPDSWNCKMLSGEPLITHEQFEKLLANGRPKTAGEMLEIVPVVKIFLPHVRWLLVNIDPNNLDQVFAVMQWGQKKPEAAMMHLSDIVNARLGEFVQPERDKYITLDKPWGHYLDVAASDW